MNPALTQGFEKLLQRSGEDLSYRGGKIRGVVNRQAPDPDHSDGYDFSGQEGATIQIPISATTRPRNGEDLQDSLGFWHRIRTYRHLGHCWELKCETSESV